MEQVIFGGYKKSAINVFSTKYNSLCGGHAWNSIGDVLQLVSTDGLIKNLRVKLDRAPGAGKSFVFTLMLNGAPTALTCTIADAAETGSDMVHEVTVTGGDYVCLRSVPAGTPAEADGTWTTVFAGDTAKESLILGNISDWGMSKTAIEYSHVMGAYGGHSITEDNFRQIVPTSGTIKNFYVKLNTDPGTAPDAYRFTLRKNGISTGLTVTITADDRTGSDLVNTVDVVAGDILTLMFEPLNDPSAAPYAAWGMTFLADIDDESIVLGGSYMTLDDTLTEYQAIIPAADMPWDVTERDHHQLGQVCTIKKLYMLLQNAPGAGKIYTFTIRIAEADSNMVVTISDAETTGNSGALEETVANDDWVNLKVVPAGTPAEVDVYWGFVCYTGAPPPPEGQPYILRVQGITGMRTFSGVVR